MIRVLFFIDRLRLGGIQALARDIILHNDRNRMTIDILNLNDGIDYPLTEELTQMGVSIYRIDAWLRTPLDFPNYFKIVDEFFERNHDYDAVHMHSSSKNYYILKCAAKWGIPVRVAHSHNTGFQSHNPATVLLGNIMKRPLKKYATDWVGCSELACEWMFGKDSIRNGEAKVILNGIESGKFIYDETVRNEVRKDLGLDGKFVVGHVGRFERQKNHEFLLDIFAEVAKRRDDAMLVLIGIGSLMEAMKQKASVLGIADRVLFLGFRDDRNRIMQAMDSFVFPSLFEGLSVVLIEAQASGLPVFASDSTTREVAYSQRMHFLPLEKVASFWADEILGDVCAVREDMAEKLEKSGFDINAMVDALYELYNRRLTGN